MKPQKIAIIILNAAIRIFNFLLRFPVCRFPIRLCLQTQKVIENMEQGNFVFKATFTLNFSLLPTFSLLFKENYRRFSFSLLSTSKFSIVISHLRRKNIIDGCVFFFSVKLFIHWWLAPGQQDRYFFPPFYITGKKKQFYVPESVSYFLLFFYSQIAWLRQQVEFKSLSFFIKIYV